MEVFAGFVGIFADNTLYVSNICFHCCNIRLFSRMGKDWKNPLLKGLSSVFISFMRGTPMMVQLLLIFIWIPLICNDNGISTNTWDPIIML